MLQFSNYNITYDLEVPGETCLNLHIAECQNRCCGCFSKELWESTNEPLFDCCIKLTIAYLKQISCVCFLGEGKNEDEEHSEFHHLCNILHRLHLKTCLYSGRDCTIEGWMDCFDYIKVGSYNPDRGPISCSSTNQRIFRKTDNGYQDITSLLWR